MSRILDRGVIWRKAGWIINVFSGAGDKIPTVIMRRAKRGLLEDACEGKGEEVAVEIRCSRCGRLIGYYKGEEVWLEITGPYPVNPDDVNFICFNCRLGDQSNKSGHISERRDKE